MFKHMAASKLYVWMLPNVWVASKGIGGTSKHIQGASTCTYTTYRKPCFVKHTGGVHMPHTYGCIHNVWIPHMFEHPCMFGCSHKLCCLLCVVCPLYSLDNPHMFTCFHIFGWCLDAPLGIHNNMKGCFVHTYSGHVYMPPNIGVPKHTGLVCQTYVWRASICLAVPLYVWVMPNIWWHPNHTGGASKYNEGASKHIGGSKHTEGIQMCGGIWTPPQSDKACFICVVYVQQTSKHLPGTYGGIQTYRRVSKHGGHPNIQGLSKHMGVIKTYRWVHPNKWGHPNILEGVQTYAGIETYRGLSKHKGGIQTYRGCIQINGGHPNILGVSKYMGASKHTGGCLNIKGASKHTGGYPNISGGIQT